jgi:6-phosphogluconolactonase/glucosamine-6-phosphate isomerase/deaminase/pimeloyl-ACP methyl ester carboxylesterase
MSSKAYRVHDRPEDYIAPHTEHFHEKEDFDKAVGEDFIKHANRHAAAGKEFFVGLGHGISPSGPYQYILDHFDRLDRPDLLYFTFTNTLMRSQEKVEDFMDARKFLKSLIKTKKITSDQVFRKPFDPEQVEEHLREYNDTLFRYLHKNDKHGFDYAFLASTPAGKVAAITRNSKAFGSEDIVTAVRDGGKVRLTVTPYFLKRAERIAFLATKSDKRRALAWLYSPWGSSKESPSFLRHLDDLKERMTVYIDDQALTWPQLELVRETAYGDSLIRIDLAQPYKEKQKKKLPVILLIHGFLGLNSFDGLLTAIPTHKYIAAAMHYGSIPNDLPPKDYSQHVVLNIDHAIRYFGERGHRVYLFDHSMGNIYFLMMDQQYQKLEGVKKYLCGRIGANPFFGEEAKHALLGFLDTIILPSMSIVKYPGEKTFFMAMRRVIPMDTKQGVRKRGINLTKWMINATSSERDLVWQASKDRILALMSNMDSLPDLNRIPISRALNRLPARIFAIQVHSALIVSKAFDKQDGLPAIERENIPVLIIKSDKDGVARFVNRLYRGNTVRIVDVTQHNEKDRFREHLFHMVDPMLTSELIEEFVEETQQRCKELQAREMQKDPASA